MSQTKFWDITWNVLHGCTKVSEGCENCHQLRFARRFHQTMGCWKGTADKNGNWTGQINYDKDALALPLKWKKPKRIFVNMTGDTFHPNVSDGQIMRIFEVMFGTPWHTYLVVTKRPERMVDFVSKWLDLTGEDFMAFKDARGPDAVREAHKSGRGELFADMLDTYGPKPEGAAWPTFDWAEGMMRWPALMPDNILPIATTENQARFNERIPWLLKLKQLGVPKVGIIVEPILEMVNIEPFLESWTGKNSGLPEPLARALESLPDLLAIDLVICGPENGSRKRPFYNHWARHLYVQCKDAGVPFFWKGEDNDLPREWPSKF